MPATVIITRFLFFWIVSSLLATALYYLLWAVMPEHYVFGGLFRMFVYHRQYPVGFIAIPCFFYAILATIFSGRFLKRPLWKQVLFIGIIIILTVLLSAPFGGMLWHYYDMKAGYFPQNWFARMMKQGFSWGIQVGWLIIVLSIPYNILCSIGCYFLTKKGCELVKYD